ncbi:hypothetical protein PVL30_005545 [Lodderomyces elongisporus]|uniref:ATP-dependent (S)-NAD(P)H-hydrate dehydratase n=1 Tax=Lodderomyces elongisporus (strain ATCC 11503 / CBS 2605 / JCM 1781 / NBRC 1676 / NRRL YB-4239) TaxID=379508 RepID=A5E5C6_LODEL|nr:uncharacterized protein PVL30_005545 [Lodderomyces elongisporus]EDK46634.1 conserved hypothetical protein [Lodderomyces elongisporus NRRL YB-4239]WLF81745.1 hypothetical protein PVL30_005545 [Lodderomyces elongisporus]
MLRNKSHKELIKLSQNLIQPLLPQFHKGQAGKVCVIGGNEDYTGAPFFSSHSAALVGADLSHVICEKQAAPVIKSYTPDLMVHPYLLDLENPSLKIDDDELHRLKNLSIEEILESNSGVLTKIIDDLILPKVQTLLSKSDIVVVGPGFGRDPLMLKTLVRIIEEIKVLNKPLILDADSLYLLSIQPQIITNYAKAIITPNVVEFQRIAKKFNIDIDLSKKYSQDTLIDQTQQISDKLGNVLIIRKGENDIIANTKAVVVNSHPGSNKRVGGQGDTLTGAIATLVNWSNNYLDSVWGNKVELDADDAHILACYAAGTLVRVASDKAFKKYGRSMQTSNIHEFLHEAFRDLFDDSIFRLNSNI